MESLYHDTCLAQSSDRFHRFHKAALIRVPGSDHPHQGTKFLSGRLDAERCYFACACACIKTPQRVCTLDQLQTPSPCYIMLPSTLLTQHIYYHKPLKQATGHISSKLLAKRAAPWRKSEPERLGVSVSSVRCRLPASCQVLVAQAAGLH